MSWEFDTDAFEQYIDWNHAPRMKMDWDKERERRKEEAAREQRVRLEVSNDGVQWHPAVAYHYAGMSPEALNGTLFRCRQGDRCSEAVSALQLFLRPRRK